MNNFESVLNNLQAFIRKYYLIRLVKGTIVFLTSSALLLVVLGTVESVFWLAPGVRFGLFLVGGMLVLLFIYHYILTPCLYLFKVKQGIGHKEAARIIGKHFKDIDDSLSNVLDLSEEADSDLILAAINQKSEKLKTIPFVNAVDSKRIWKYAYLLMIPIGILFLYLVSGFLGDYFKGIQRIADYKTAYVKPAPFQFWILNDNLNTNDNQGLSLSFTTKGSVKPEEVFILFQGKRFLAENRRENFQFDFPIEKENFSFQLLAGNVYSKIYKVDVVKTPLLTNFQMLLNYPKYLGMQNRVVNGTGDVKVPYGTTVTWKVKGSNLDLVGFIEADSVSSFMSLGNEFKYQKRIFNRLDYQIQLGNASLKEYENIPYTINVIKDEYPSISVTSKQDSLVPNESFFSGKVLDDYGINKVEIVYKEVNGSKESSLILEKNLGRSNQFYYTFPQGLNLSPGKEYSFYFKVTDNDGVVGGKSITSEIFTTNILSNQELENRLLETSKSLSDGINEQISKREEIIDQLEQLDQEFKTQTDFGFNKKEEVRKELREQLDQERLMEKFANQLKESLNEKDELLRERLERQEMLAKKNQQLLEELEKVADKINKEELQMQLDKLAKSQAANKRSLEQIVELTKRYYVAEKAKQLAEEIYKLGERQELLYKLKLVDKDNESSQQSIKNKFSPIKEQFSELLKENESLKKGFDLDVDHDELDEINKDLEDIKKEFEKHNLDENVGSDLDEQSGSKLKSKQRSVGAKMKELGDKVSFSASNSGSTVAEDADMLRQILDNLLIFSFKQEGLMERMNFDRGDLNSFSNSIREQKKLRELFSHVDDSLFALSLRQVELADFVNEQVEEVYYNMDKGLESIAENQLFQAKSYQQYALTASNSLADYLVNVLDNMQDSMNPGKGEGNGQDFQLPDIIRKQEGLSQKMGAGNDGKQEDGNQGSGMEGDAKSGNSDGKNGNSGKNGDGKNGDASDGNQGRTGNGKHGESNGKGDGKSEGNGEGGSGNGSGMSEDELQEIFEIYKAQQQIRSVLEKQLEDILNDEERKLAKSLVKQMQDFEDRLLENGITKENINRVNVIQQQLLKLKDSELKQGKDPKRDSEKVKGSFSNTINKEYRDAREYFQQTEILNRQPLPLQTDFKNRVKSYFNTND